ncbi:MAG TPA: RbsD/FucU family protein [Propionibacteriaceae bacterium]|nr:RbsD/FucU family protein [Propionibacteriaceae bacterium]
MLLTELLHPEILAGLASAGHGSKVLLADGHYPASTVVGRQARTVYLNLTPGLLNVSTVLDVLLRTIPIEAAAVMVPLAAEPEPEAIREYRDRLTSVPVEELDRFAFYAQARSDDLALLIVTADVRTYANLLLTLGVRSN